eukprot:TRINITY_DN4761_c0_g1_i1.p2 TRINITY_DN4761_c0_g1~~TRINITY_DN4761_c0_g1_i1.p2  ORF type:complete len:234 (-),score=62.84 TRINITY_DN4761_c0_g1_i1:48-656(-)
MYEQDGPPTFSRDAWLSEKHTLGLDFPNLPYLIDGEVKLTESSAIMGYIARKHGLCGADEKTQAVVAMLAGVASDFRSDITRVAYNPNFAKLRAELVSGSVTAKTEALSRFLGDKAFFTGASVTYVDFVLYDLVDIVLALAPELAVPGNLLAFHERIEALPAIKAYLESGKYLAYPLNNKIAAWGGATTEATDRPAKKRRTE